MSDCAVLGIDGGGSKTLIALADKAGKSSRVARGQATQSARQPRLARCARDASSRPCRGQPISAASLPRFPPMARSTRSPRRSAEAIAASFGGRVASRVLNDVDAAHIGAFAGGPGILDPVRHRLDGLGARRRRTSCRVGGWGDAIGDEGSSHWIGRRVSGAVSQAIDGRACADRACRRGFRASRNSTAADPMDATGGLGVAAR